MALEFEVVHTRTNKSIAAARRLRYEVFFREKADARYADHKRLEWGDNADSLAHLVNAYLNGQLVGSLRLHLGTEGRLWFETSDQLSDIPGASADVTRSAAEITRTVVRSDVRGSGIARALVRRAEKLCIAEGQISLIYAVVSPCNHPPKAVLRSLEYIQGPTTTDAFSGLVFYKWLVSTS